MYNMIPALSIALRSPDADSRSTEDVGYTRMGREMWRRISVSKVVDLVGDDSDELSRSFRMDM